MSDRRHRPDRLRERAGLGHAAAPPPAPRAGDAARVPRLELGREEDPQNQSRYYLRALGPQIEVIVSPSGEAAARSLCQRLAAAGLPVTHLSIDSTPHPQTRIYHRGASGPARAQRVASLLGGQPSTEELRKPGWLDLVVVLGAP